MKREYQVAVILVNYNSSEYTLACVDSILAQTTAALRFQIVVVDNNSRLEEFVKLAALKELMHVQLFRNKINTGFSGANMMGVQLADADYYYFLNNDCVLLNDCLALLHSFSEQHTRVASCTGLMFNADMEHNHSFNYFPTLSLKLLGSGLLRWMYPEQYPDKHKPFKHPAKVDLISGSSMFIRASAFEAIGGMDTNYFLYCEEEDIALRLNRSGYDVFVVPEAKYQHFIRKSTESETRDSLVFLKEFYISLLYFYRKNFGFGYRMAVQVLLFLKMLLKFYNGTGYVKLAFFILAGANVKHSLRFKQKITPR
jgi:GT2 family glycosyltransferase